MVEKGSRRIEIKNGDNNVKFNYIFCNRNRNVII